MTFDTELAHRILRQRDRDRTLFFAGRQAEIDSFDHALAEAADSCACVFRIFQGAPGCGKTSLAAHLRTLRDEALFVSLFRKDLLSEGAVIDCIHVAVRRAQTTKAKAGEMALKSVSEWLKLKEARADINRLLIEHAYRNTSLVLHLDEAQELSQRHAEAVAWLHTGGLNMPAVCLFTGLSHTKSRIRNLGGMSRLAANAVVDVGRMSRGECVASTHAMLAELGAVGDAEQSKAAAAQVAELSLGWPQHLFRAQQALCRELVRTNGALGAVARETVSRESEQSRFDYYQARLDGSLLGEQPSLTAEVARAVANRRVRTLTELGDICERRIKRMKKTRRKIDADEFAQLMLEKGVVTYAANGDLDMAIPSMAAWLEDAYKDGQAGLAR